MYAPLDWLALGFVFLTALGLGIVVHELLHVVPLHLVGATYTVSVLPADDTAPSSGWASLQHALTSGLVRVEVIHVPSTAPAWVVRAAALLPLALAFPLVLMAAGILPNPIATGNHAGTVALIAVTGCGLPSPGDWAVAWHGSRLGRRR